MNHEKEAAEMVRAEIDSLIMRDFASNRTFGALSPDVQKKMIELERKIERGENMIENDRDLLGSAAEQESKQLSLDLSEAKSLSEALGFKELPKPESVEALVEQALPNNTRTKRLAGLLPGSSVIDLELPIESYEDEAPKFAKWVGSPMSKEKEEAILAARIGIKTNTDKENKKVYHIDMGGISTKEEEIFLAAVAREKRKLATLEGMKENFVMDSKEASVIIAEYDSVSKPKHYNAPNGMQAIDVIEGFNLSFSVGNAVKYLLRGNVKHETPKEDYLKVLWYVSHELKRLGFEEEVRAFFKKQIADSTI